MARFYTYSNLRGATKWSRPERPGASGGSGGGERIHDVVNHLLDQELVVTFAHNPDHRLRAGGADEQTGMTIGALLGVFDGGADAGVVEGLAAFVAHVLKYLRQRIEAVAHLRYRL